MTVDRRTVLRSTARLAALGAAAGVTTACGDSGDTPVRTDPGPEQSTGTAAPWPSAPATPADSPAAATPSPTVAPSLPPLSPTTPIEVVNGPRDRPQVALTFHGQGDPALALALLAAAEQHGARLTILAVGVWLDQQPQLARRILDGGHELGNHTQNHLDISRMPAAQARAEVQQCADRLRRLTGSIGRWFRPSSAQYATPMVRAQARLVGYEHCLSYDVDPRDYTDPGAEVVQRRVLKAAIGGSVIALHMGHRGTVEALPAILTGLAEAGLSAVTTSQLCA
ncbi:polysaccharide deacetylase family protein [Saccharothrix sp. ST-888]|uniref:polysaccharide deacetylase family protein n=1 Tax=Saccharothrix sp. ST-888 TaxID=1427391 RepID=UPI0009E5A95B|nr:polysaccharide deacetylase family protein [Saccharothrix sp. ST-888]